MTATRTFQREFPETKSQGKCFPDKAGGGQHESEWKGPIWKFSG